MPLYALFRPSHRKPPRYRSAVLRHVGLLWLRTRRMALRIALRVTLFGGWVWFAAASLIGIEAFDILFGMFALAPELLPFAVVGLALIWSVRGHLRRLRRHPEARRTRKGQTASGSVPETGKSGGNVYPRRG